MLLTGCDYMFLSPLLSVTVDVLVSTAEDDGKNKKVCKHFLLLSLCSPCLPLLPSNTLQPPTFH